MMLIMLMMQNKFTVLSLEKLENIFLILVAAKMREGFTYQIHTALLNGSAKVNGSRIRRIGMVLVDNISVEVSACLDASGSWRLL